MFTLYQTTAEAGSPKIIETKPERVSPTGVYTTTKGSHEQENDGTVYLYNTVVHECHKTGGK